MVFLPINIRKCHWYLSVLNAKKREIHVLDSLGIGMSRSDLTDDQFTQEDMKEFRRKLAVILLETELNKLKGSPIYYEPDNEEKVSDSDVELLDDRKRKRQDSPNGAEDKSPLPTPIMSVDPHDLVDKICNDIMSINDVDLLEKEWVRSSKPHLIGLSLRRIQDILCRDQPLDIDCFNMAIRILACDKALLTVDPPVRYMDLQFSTAVTEAALASARDLDSRVQPDIQELGALLRSWTEIERNISSCNLILLPHRSLGHYILFAINKHARQVSLMDPLFPSLSSERYALKFQRVSFYLNDALELAQPGWTSDIFFWPRKSAIDVPTSLDRYESGYFVFHFMLSWYGNKFVRPICTDGYEPRKNFLIYLLDYHANEVEENISYDIRQILKCLK
ncbi:hypothetical protein D1007_44945 [Hordeum vulgare]|nr:hypothetical protein D1007_44945 [Hordeum vulgare]